MQHLSQSLQRLAATLEQHHPEWHVAKPLQGLAPAELKTAFADMAVSPIELIAFLELYDFNCCRILPFFDEFRPAEYADRVSHIIAQYEDASTIFESSFVGWTSSTLGSCKLDKCWRRSWIPIGENNGDYFFIDMEPTHLGLAGQVVRTSETGKYLSVIASSLRHLLDRISSAVENGKTAESRYNDLFLSQISAHNAG